MMIASLALALSLALPGNDLADPAVLQDGACVHHRNLFTSLSNDANIMGDEQE